jgi:hypothetical protein
MGGHSTRLSRRLGNHCTRAHRRRTRPSHISKHAWPNTRTKAVHSPLITRSHSVVQSPSILRLKFCSGTALYYFYFILFYFFLFSVLLLKSSALSVQFFGHRSAAQFPRHAPFKQGSPPSVRDSGSDHCSIMQNVPASIRHQYTRTHVRRAQLLNPGFESQTYSGPPPLDAYSRPVTVRL